MTVKSAGLDDYMACGSVFSTKVVQTFRNDLLPPSAGHCSILMMGSAGVNSLTH